ncbi:DUF3987 domain-containing protein [Methylotuvimicrobium sp. KM1]|uniref:DUF3987 domain-containing protein n=1 Tax=Methylotuvimicrobium sp. KM1 TaxID=3377707 RepID=UPI00385005B4
MYEKQVDRSYGEKIEKFNSIYDLHLLLRGARFVEDINAVKFEFIDRILYSLYYDSNSVRLDVQLNCQNGLIDIYISNGVVLENSFDVYVYFYHAGNATNALNWEYDQRINIAQPQIRQLPSQYQQSQQCQGWPYQPPPPPTPPTFQGYPKPTLDIDFVLDNSIPKQYLKLEDCLHDKDSLSCKLPQYISHKTDISNGTNIMLTLSVFSGLTSKRFKCSYKDGRTVSIGLYAVLEQSSGTSKSLALSILLEPFKNMIESKISEIKSSIQEQEKKLDKLNESLAGCTTKEDRAYNKKQIAETKNLVKKLYKKLNRLQNLMSITTATSAALDAMLTTTGGFFFVATSEQGFFNSILGLRNGSKYNNDDLLLNGREGGDVNNKHLNRKSYSGPVRGAIACFAQEGLIGKLLAASCETGLAERFFMISEPSSIGYRDRITDKINGNHILEQYAKRCEFFKIYIDDENALSHDLLITLRISDDGWRHIANFEQELEYKMRPGAEFSHPILQRVIGKTKMQVMGIAANLYLLHTENPPTSASDDPFIPDEFVVIAIKIFNQLIIGVRGYCERKGLISDVPQLNAVYNVFIGKSENAAFTQQELKKRLHQVKPFKDMEQPRKAIQQALDYLVQHHILLIDANGNYFKNPVKYDPNCR